MPNEPEPPNVVNPTHPIYTRTPEDVIAVVHYITHSSMDVDMIPELYLRGREVVKTCFLRYVWHNTDESPDFDDSINPVSPPVTLTTNMPGKKPCQTFVLVDRKPAPEALKPPLGVVAYDDTPIKRAGDKE